LPIAQQNQLLGNSKIRIKNEAVAKNEKKAIVNRISTCIKFFDTSFEKIR
jgi:hypothetical protein